MRNERLGCTVFLSGCFEESVTHIKSLLEIHDLHDIFPEVTAVIKNSSAADDLAMDSAGGQLADVEQEGSID